MKLERTRLFTGVTLAMLTFPLIEVGTCISIAKESVAAGFVDVVTPLIVEQVEPYFEQAALAAANRTYRATSDPADVP